MNCILKDDAHRRQGEQDVGRGILRRIAFFGSPTC